MEIPRKAYDKLPARKNNENHKPIIVEGLRQIGKSCIVGKSAREYYKNVIVNDLRRLNIEPRSCLA